MKMTIAEFCRKHRAYPDVMKWALENCQNMDEVWEKAKPYWLVWVATREGVLTDKELRLFAVWCARQVQHLMTDKRSITGIDVAERYANGNATDEELKAAWMAARDAAAVPPTNMMTWTAAWVARAATSDEAWMAAWRAAEAAGDTVGAANRIATRAAQAQYLRKNCKPNFER